MKNLLSSRLLMLLTLLLGVVSAATAADRFYADAVNFEPGESKTIAFNLDNSQEFFGFQADITLPYGLEVLSVNYKPDVTLSSRANSSYTLVSNQLSAESIRVGAFSTNHTPISGNSGTLLYVNVKASDSFSGGTLSVTDILFTDASNSDVVLPDYTAELDTKHNDKFYISDFKIAVGETKEIALVLDNETPFAAFQTDIYLPDGLVIIANSPKMTSRGSSHTLSAKSFTDGRVRLACLSMNNSVFTGNSGELVTLQILATKDVAETCTIELKNNIFSMTNAKEYVLPNSTTIVTTERVLVESIILNQSSVTLSNGETMQLIAQVIPTYASTKEVAWTSSNDKFATVNEGGIVTGIAPGNTQIKAVATDGSGVNAYCEVNVTGIPVTAISLNKRSINLKGKETAQLSATVEPANAYDKNIVWTSEDESIATVDTTGLITAVAVGSVRIIAASVSNPEISSECTINVIPTLISEILISNTSVWLEGGDTFLLSASVSPETASNKQLEWESDDESVAIVDETGLVTAVGAGKTTIRVRAQDGSNVSASCYVNVVPTAADGITIETPTSTSFKVGESIALSAIVSPANASDKSVVWASNAPEIATVNSEGIASAVKVGSATITATNSAGLSADIELTVIPTLAERIVVTPSSYSLKVGNGYNLLTTIYPETTTDKSVSWTSSDPNVVTVDETGHVNAISLGIATITATVQDGSGVAGVCEITVTPTPANGIKIEYSGKTSLYVGDEIALSATVTPNDAADKTVTWQTQNAEVLQVNGQGVVKAVGLGEAWISATNSAGQSVYMTFKVIPTPVSNIELSTTTTDIHAGQTTLINAVVSPGNATNKSLSWDSNNESIASVDQNGLVTGISVGAVDINARATDGSGVIQAIRINVVQTPVETVSISAEGPTTLKATETVQLSASISPSNATDKNVVWSSDNESIATVDQYGTVTAVSVGKANITAAVGGKSSTIEITVEKTLATAIALNRTSAIMKVDGQMQLTVQFTPETTTDKSIKWTSSNASIAIVSENGTIRALQLGECVITATAQDGSNVSTTCHIKVEETAAESIAISPKGPFSLHIGETVQLGATVLPATSTDKSVTWQSQTTGVSVDEDGLVTALAPVENNWIMATNSAGQSDYVYVTVLPTLVSSIEVDKPEVSLKVNERVTITAEVLPVDATNKAIEWSSYNPEVATVSTDGVITAHSIGDALLLVMAKDGSNTYANVTVHVVPTPTDGITFEELGTTTLKVGEAITLQVKITPEDATDKSVTWSSSDTGIATVDENGRVTAVGVGTVKITAISSGGQKVEITLTVLPTKAQSIALSQSSAEMKVGNTLQLTATILPSTTTDKSVSWSSSDNSVVAVDENGVVTALAIGDAIITATANDGSSISASCSILVVATPVESVKIIYDGPTTVNVGFTTQMAAEVTPSTATDKSLSWMGQNDNIIHVEKDGLIVATGPGDTWVGVATSNGIYDYLNFKVLPNPVERIELSTENHSIKVGETTQLTATVFPENATYKTLSWDSNDESIATVDQNGLVTGVGLGQVDINARATDGSYVIQAVRINVISTPVESIAITANGSTTLKDGETVTLTANIMPTTATDTSITWTSDNEDVATVADGIVTAHRTLGTTRIRATAHNGIAAEIEVTVEETPVESISIGYYGDSNEILDGESLYVSAQVYPATATYPEITWSVSDESIISIDIDGSVSALYPGEAYVYAESSNGIKESLLIIVKPILIERIEFTDHFSVPLYSEPGVRTQVKLEPRIYPENASIQSLHWTSSDGSVGMPWNTADGIVFWATGLGETTLTCYTEDGSNITHTVDVKVINPLTGISLDEHILTLYEQQSIELVATMEPIDATGYVISWISSDDNVATVDNGLVEAIAEGKCVIKVHGASGLGTAFTDECNVTVSKESGIQSVSFDEVNIKIDETNIIIENLGSGCKASVYEINGVHLMSQISNGENIIFNLNSKGYYIVSIGKYALKVCIK